MKWIGLVAALGLGAGALAAPAPRVEPRPTWADWVGDYEGKLAWTGCFTPGAARARISVDAVDGAVFIDLIDAGGGLRSMSLVEEQWGWSAQSGDVKLRVQRPRDRALYLDAEVGSDCRMQANLVRATTKIAACDRLIGWARVESKCGKLTDPPLEDVAKLAKESRSWKPRGKTVSGSCEGRATRVETSLIDAGCAPMHDPQAFVPGPQCQDLIGAVARFKRCATATPKTIGVIDYMMSKTATTAADEATRTIVGKQCRELHDFILVRARHEGCM